MFTVSVKRQFFLNYICLFSDGEKIEDFHHHYVSVPAQQTYVLLSCALKIQWYTYHIYEYVNLK